MISLIIDSIISSAETSLMSGGDYGADDEYLVSEVTNRNITIKSLNKTISVIESSSTPTEFEISSTHGQSKETYFLEIYIFVKEAKEEDAKKTRRVILQRLKRLMLKRNGSFFQNLLTTKYEDANFKETVQKYKVVEVFYDNDQLEGNFYYLAQINLAVSTEINYN